MKIRNIILANLIIAAALTGCKAQAGGEIPVAAPPVAVQSRTLTPAPVPTPKPAPNVGNENSPAFAQWKTSFHEKALNAGISQRLVDEALADIYVNERVISLDRKQPEHKLTKEEYLRNVINDARIQKGRRLFAENRALLDEISKKSGVEPEFIVALWGLETGYGENTGNFSVVNSLATLAYEGRRREFFENELLSALLIIDQGHISLGNMIGSWAGAMGQCQFMPSSFLAYAVDYDGDGRADIWKNRKDVFASIANYLYTVGWGKDAAAKEKALMNWNRSSYFVASVFLLAEKIRLN